MEKWITEVSLAVFGGLLTLVSGFYWRDRDHQQKEIGNLNAKIETVTANMQEMARREELTNLQIRADLRFDAVERDVKNLGEKFAEILRREVSEMRQELHRHSESQISRLDEHSRQSNERLDKIMVMVSQINKPL